MVFFFFCQRLLPFLRDRQREGGKEGEKTLFAFPSSNSQQTLKSQLIAPKSLAFCLPLDPRAFASMTSLDHCIRCSSRAHRSRTKQTFGTCLATVFREQLKASLLIELSDHLCEQSSHSLAFSEAELKWLLGKEGAQEGAKEGAQGQAAPKLS